MADDPKIINLRDRVPELDSGHFEQVHHVKRRSDVYHLRVKADDAVAAALADGMSLRDLAAAVTKAGRVKKCRHPSSTIDPDLRELRCDECGQLWDPFDLVLDIAYHERRLYRELVERPKLRAEIEALTAQRDDMARRAKNEKARLARARKSRDKVERLNDLERYELDRARELSDLVVKINDREGPATQAERAEAGRLQGLLLKLARDRR